MCIRDRIINTPCHKCNGKGKVRTRKKIEVNIPAGIDNNQKMCIRDRYHLQLQFLLQLFRQQQLHQ